MKNYLSIMALVLMFGVMYAADDRQLTDCKSALNANDAALEELKARRINSLMEAYMEGKFAASKNEGCLKYDDYEARASHEENWAFEDTVEKVSADIRAIYGPIKHAIDSWMPFDFHIMLEACEGKKGKISYLKKLQETDKTHIQTLRLYDFLECINMDVPDAVLQESQKLKDNKELSEQDKAKADKKLMDPLHEAVARIKASRVALHKAVNAGDVVQVLEACKEPLHITQFVPLNAAILKMIASIKADKDNVLLNNDSRTQRQCAIS